MALSEKIKPIRVTTILEKITKSNKPKVAGHEGLEKENNAQERDSKILLSVSFALYYVGELKSKDTLSNIPHVQIVCIHTHQDRADCCV